MKLLIDTLPKDKAPQAFKLKNLNKDKAMQNNSVGNSI
jgi:hypothetical protein